jgi:L-ribulokinase
MCGVVDGGITPGLYGYEAGQSAVGDIFAWYVEQCVPASYHAQAAERGLSVHELLSELAGTQRIGQHGLVALDWFGGNRSVLVDHTLAGVIVGQTLATTAPEVYRALLEATAFGTRIIIESFEAAGVAVHELVVAGGLLRNRLLMQIYADVTRRPLSLIESDQGPALGAAMHAAVAAGAYHDIYAAAEAMGKMRPHAYTPDPAAADAYDALYAEYKTLHDYFGRGANDVLHRLRAISLKAYGAQESVVRDAGGVAEGAAEGAAEQVSA